MGPVAELMETAQEDTVLTATVLMVRMVLNVSQLRIVLEVTVIIGSPVRMVRMVLPVVIVRTVVVTAVVTIYVVTV